ncbi:PspA/IM30 family protein [Methylomonas sp. SURF-2]|uniref:PspA/IM30 family protein n=1 Tax=Methylomonas subterranea TaxID=2952225 RepID=A0ABT1TEX9_9GAMM|nr:PspA/IM30 family protein [Methylomonas sp. SURF-2]MCQ8104023.1 PspA/IM30 family protein [Methylomonas sp. SURF-2]
MNLLNKLMTALRGVANEAGESIVDAQGIRILEQEVRDAKAHLEQAKESLTEVIAEQMAVQRRVGGLRTSVEEHEHYAVRALAKNDENLALEVAEKVAKLSNELDTQTAILEGLNANVGILKQSIAVTERNIQGMERELALVKTTESVNRANEAVASRFSGSRSALRSATESLERIKAKQQKKADQMQAALDLQQEENGEKLHNKLQEAGIVTKKATAASVLERLKAQQPQEGV